MCHEADVNHYSAAASNERNECPTHCSTKPDNHTAVEISDCYGDAGWWNCESGSASASGCLEGNPEVKGNKCPEPIGGDANIKGHAAKGGVTASAAIMLGDYYSAGYSNERTKCPPHSRTENVYGASELDCLADAGYWGLEDGVLPTESPTEPPTAGATVEATAAAEEAGGEAPTTECNGKNTGCTAMVEGDGDCDADSDCNEGLICGVDNCKDFHDSSSWPIADEDAWDTEDDCCYNPDAGAAVDTAAAVEEEPAAKEADTAEEPAAEEAVEEEDVAEEAVAEAEHETPVPAPAGQEPLETGIAAGDACIESSGTGCSGAAVDAVIAAAGTFEDAVKAGAMTATKVSIIAGDEVATVAANAADASEEAAAKFPDAVLEDYVKAAAAGAAAAASSILGGGNVVETAKAAEEQAVGTTPSQDGSLAAQAGSAAWALAAAIGFTPSEDGTTDQEAIDEVVLVCFSAAHWDVAATLRLQAQTQSAKNSATTEADAGTLSMMGAAAGCIACAAALFVARQRRLQSEWIVNGEATSGSSAILIHTDSPTVASL